MACPRFNLSRRRDMFGSETCGCCFGATARLVLAARSQRSADAHDRSGGVYDVREGYFLASQLPGQSVMERCSESPLERLRIARPSWARSARATAASSTRLSSGRSAARRLARRPRRRAPAARSAATFVSATATASRPVASVARVARPTTWAPTERATKDAPAAEDLKGVPQLLRKLVERCFPHDSPSPSPRRKKVKNTKLQV